MPRICFRTSEREIEFADGDSVNLLRVAIRNECGVPWRCASGNCGTDRVLVEEGADQMDAPRKRERERLGDLLGQGYRLACQSYVHGDVTVSWDPNQKGLDEETRAGERLKQVWLGADDTA